MMPFDAIRCRSMPFGVTANFKVRIFAPENLQAWNFQSTNI